MKTLFILNDSPYGTERTYNALRLAMTLQKDAGAEVRIFLLADAVTAILPGQGTPPGYYNIERMLKSILAKGGQVKACGTCCEARGIKSLPHLDGATVGSMSELARWTDESEKMIVF